MSLKAAPTVGILPPGALGVAFYHHLTRGGSCRAVEAVFLTRRTSAQAARWSAESVLRIETERGLTQTTFGATFAGDLLAAAAVERLPEVVLVCTNPDQLFDVLTEYVALVEFEHAAGRLHVESCRLPWLMLCANGIYFQRVRSSFIELLEEATLLGRLPDLWPDVMPLVVGRLMRGVTVQTAVRRGSGSEAVYRPGPSGRTLVAGGDRQARARIVAQLTACGGWFEDAGSMSPTRAEFEKALINLSSNVFGQLASINASGKFQLLTVAQIVTPERGVAIRELVDHVLRIGRGVGVYPKDETAASIYERVTDALKGTAAHVPSSLQWLEQQLTSGKVPTELAPTETWLLRPLQHFARSLHDDNAIAYFEGLEAELIRTLGRARPPELTGREQALDSA